MQVEDRKAIADYASNILTEKVGEKGVHAADKETFESCIKQALCFNALKAEANSNELTPELTKELSVRAEIMSQNLKASELHILSEKAFIRGLARWKEGNITEEVNVKVNKNREEMFVSKLDNEKVERALKPGLDEEIIKNTKLDMSDLNVPISKTTLLIYGEDCGIKVDLSKRVMMAKQASAFLEEKIGKENFSQASAYDLKYCIKQSFCFEALKKELNLKSVNLQITKELCEGAGIMANQLSDGEMHIVNNKMLMRDLCEVLISSDKLGHEKIMDRNNLEVFTDILKQSTFAKSLQQDINAFTEKNLKLDREEGNVITRATVYDYAKACNVYMQVEDRKAIADYASNILIEKVGEKGVHAADKEIFESCIKRALCFNALKAEANSNELTPELTKELSVRAEIMSHNLKSNEMHTLNNRELMAVLSGDRIGEKAAIDIPSQADKIAEIICHLTNDGLIRTDGKSMNDPSLIKEVTPEIQKSQGLELEI